MVNKPLLRFISNFNCHISVDEGIAMKNSMSCFVITPYGDPNGTPEQRSLAENIGALIENIIRPVGEYCKERGFDVRMEIGYDERQESSIWKKIGERIEAAETVIAVVASDGPNTYLELGLAFGLWMRPIILRFGGWPVPTDINNLERVEVSYDQAFCRNGADPRPIIAEVGDRLISIIRSGRRRPPNLFDSRLTSYGTIRTMSRFSTVTSKEWSDILNNAAERIVLVLPKGMTVQKQMFAAPNGTQETLPRLLTRRVVYDGIDVTVVTNHPDMITPEYLKRTGADDIEEFRDELQRAFIRWNTVRLSIDRELGRMDRTGLDRAPGRFRYVQAAGNQLPYRITLTDKRMLLTLRFIEEPYNSHYCIDAPIGPQSHDDNLPLVRLIEADIARIIKMNEERSEQQYQEWAERQASR